MEFMTFKNGHMLKVHDIDTACKNFCDEISEIVHHAQERNQILSDENKKLKDEHYKDAEIQRLLAENEKYRAELRRGFYISEEEQEDINKWEKEHIKAKHKGKSYSGTIGGRFKYIFTPTSIGEIGEIECSCGEKYTFRVLC